jgi:hypothetical protein
MLYRYIIRIIAAAAALGGIMISQDASAQRYSAQELQYYCSLGSQTPRSMRPYCGGGGGYRYAPPPRVEYVPQEDYGWYGSRRLRRDDLAYYCSMGSQTPRSLRGQCARYGFW